MGALSTAGGEGEAESSMPATGSSAATPSRAKMSFWLDGGYDFELVQACLYHPAHKWWTFRLGDVVKNCHNPDQPMTICSACYVPRCGTTEDSDRCKLWRHHETEHVYESGVKEPVGGW